MILSLMAGFISRGLVVVDYFCGILAKNISAKKVDGNGVFLARGLISPVRREAIVLDVGPI